MTMPGPAWDELRAAFNKATPGWDQPDPSIDEVEKMSNALQELAYSWQLTMLPVYASPDDVTWTKFQWYTRFRIMTEMMRYADQDGIYIIQWHGGLPIVSHDDGISCGRTKCLRFGLPTQARVIIDKFTLEQWRIWFNIKL